jgi:L-ascorbate metabolism protein UlaG (beta-lactamase superfamily)
MTGEQAVALLRPRLVVPVHYGGWAHFREGRAEVETAFRRAPPDVRDRVRWVEPGGGHRHRLTAQAA